MKNDSCRIKVNEYIFKKYGAKPEYLWQRDPNSCIYRHEDNRKWFAIIMVIPRDRLSTKYNSQETESDTDYVSDAWQDIPASVQPRSEKVEILNLKLADVLAAELVTQQPGFFSAYHMGKGSTWVTVILDGTVSAEDIYPFIDESFAVTASAKSKSKTRPPKEWLVPANPKYYDIEAAFSLSDTIEWKQGAAIKTGDTVYMYVAAPVSAVLYKCTVVETDIPYTRHNDHIRIKSLMKIKREKVYDKTLFTFSVLKNDYGIFAVRGPRSVPNELSHALNF